MNREHYRYLKTFLRALDKQLNLELALVDPVLNRFLDQGRSHATTTPSKTAPARPTGSGEIALATRLRIALRDLYKSTNRYLQHRDLVLS